MYGYEICQRFSHILERPCSLILKLGLDPHDSHDTSHMDKVTCQIRMSCTADNRTLRSHDSLLHMEKDITSPNATATPKH